MFQHYPANQVCWTLTVALFFQYFSHYHPFGESPLRNNINHHPVYDNRYPFGNGKSLTFVILLSSFWCRRSLKFWSNLHPFGEWWPLQLLQPTVILLVSAILMVIRILVILVQSSSFWWWRPVQSKYHPFGDRDYGVWFKLSSFWWWWRLESPIPLSSFWCQQYLKLL